MDASEEHAQLVQVGKVTNGRMRRSFALIVTHGLLMRAHNHRVAAGTSWKNVQHTCSTRSPILNLNADGRCVNQQPTVKIDLTKGVIHVFKTLHQGATLSKVLSKDCRVSFFIARDAEN